MTLFHEQERAIVGVLYRFTMSNARFTLKF